MSWSLRSFIPFRSLFSLAQSPCTCSTNQNVISYTLLLISFKSPVHQPKLKFWGKSSEQAQVWVPKRTRRRTPRLQARPQRRKKGEVARPRRRSGPRVKPGDVFYGLMKDELTWAFEPWQPWLFYKHNFMHSFRHCSFFSIPCNLRFFGPIFHICMISYS